ncbi:hypothetical protein GGI07_004579 [Coemansia sp. Benny D115]|nr:hypothetical protein GGI07_004579 [Coemansia sp. Benny D115]
MAGSLEQDSGEQHYKRPQMGGIGGASTASVPLKTAVAPANTPRSPSTAHSGKLHFQTTATSPPPADTANPLPNAQAQVQTAAAAAAAIATAKHTFSSPTSTHSCNSPNSANSAAPQSQLPIHIQSPHEGTSLRRSSTAIARNRRSCDISSPATLLPLSPTSPRHRRISLSGDRAPPPPLQIDKRRALQVPPITISSNRPSLANGNGGSRGGAQTAPLKHAKRDSKFDDSTSGDEIALMLARVEVANDILFSDPKRVVIEHGNLHTDKDTLRSLIDVSSPTTTKKHHSLLFSPPELADTPAPSAFSATAQDDDGFAFPKQSTESQDSTTMAGSLDTSNRTSADRQSSQLSLASSVDDNQRAREALSNDGDSAAQDRIQTTRSGGSSSSSSSNVFGNGGSSSDSGGSPSDAQPTAAGEKRVSEGGSRNSGTAGANGSSEGYKVYPEGDERALPDFILNSQTMEELDAVTGAWESALDALPDGDFWRSVVSDLDGIRRRAPLHLSAKIRAGIPARVRGVVWQTLSQARSTYLQTVYTQLIKEYSPHERIIRRDLTRTFPRIPVFKGEGGEGQQRLFRILKAYSLYDAEVGYCQGLGFIIGPLIMSMGECEAFCVLVRLMETYDLRGMFTEDMAGLHLRLYQFQILAAEILPEVMGHLELHGVVPAMYVPSWFLSLFAYTMPLNFVLRAMDVIMADGAPESIMRIGISLLQRNADKLLRQDDFESAMCVLNGGLYDDDSNARDRPGFVLQEAAKLSAVVTQQRLDELEAQYCREQGVVPRTSRPSMSAASAGAAASARASPSTGLVEEGAATTNHAIMKFLGWPWGKDSNTSGNGSGSGASAIAVGGGSAQAGSKWRLSSLGKGAAAVEDGDGRISPRVLELTESQRMYSQHLREQMLRSLQAQGNSPATMLGSVSLLTGQQQQNAGEIKSRDSMSTQSPLADDGSSAGSGDEGQGAAAPSLQASPTRRAQPESSDSTWRDEVLEPLQRQLHDARVTCNTHRDALVALQAEHEALRAELAMAKAERAGLAEENEQLRMTLRRVEAECVRSREDSEYSLERTQRSEEALIQARMDLAEADEEKALLVRQLSNLRKFIASESGMGADDAQLSPIREDGGAGIVPRARMFSMDGYHQQHQQQQGGNGLRLTPPPPLSSSATVASPTSGGGNTKPSRFSISNIASNWSAIRGAITSPRQSVNQDSAGSFNSNGSNGIAGGSGGGSLQQGAAGGAAPASLLVMTQRVQETTARSSTVSPPGTSAHSAPLSPAPSASSSIAGTGYTKPSAIPLAMLHRSKTMPATVVAEDVSAGADENNSG